MTMKIYCIFIIIFYIFSQKKTTIWLIKNYILFHYPNCISFQTHTHTMSAVVCLFSFSFTFSASLRPQKEINKKKEIQLFQRK